MQPARFTGAAQAELFLGKRGAERGGRRDDDDRLHVAAVVTKGSCTNETPDPPLSPPPAAKTPQNGPQDSDGCLRRQSDAAAVFPLQRVVYRFSKDQNCSVGDDPNVEAPVRFQPASLFSSRNLTNESRKSY